MISITRLIRLGMRAAEWATPHVKEWHRKRHLNFNEANRHLGARNWSEAEKHINLALAERRRPAKQRVELLLCLERAQRHQHKLAEAEQTVGQAIELATKASDRSGRSLGMDALVNIQIEQSKYAEAERTIKDIQRSEEAQSKPDRARLASCSRKLATAFLKSGREAEAMGAFQRAADQSEQTFGPSHLETGNNLAELGALYRQHGNQAEAQRCIRRALEIHRAQLGEDSHEATKDLHNLAASLEESGDLDGAMGEYERVLSLKERQIGTNREETADTQVRLGVLYVRAGRSSKARELLFQAVGVLERAGGERFALALETLIAAEEQAGRPADAKRWREKASKLVVKPH